MYGFASYGLSGDLRYFHINGHASKDFRVYCISMQVCNLLQLLQLALFIHQALLARLRSSCWGFSGLDFLGDLVEMGLNGGR